jgi:hypothetical protein
MGRWGNRLRGTHIKVTRMATHGSGTHPLKVLLEVGPSRGGKGPDKVGGFPHEAVVILQSACTGT